MISQKQLKSLVFYDAVSGVFRWKNCPSRGKRRYSFAGNINTDGYLRIRIHGKQYQAHRLAWLYIYGKFPKYQLDHANGDRADNRLCNLREATYQQNAWNRKTPKSNKLGMKGVYENGGWFYASISFDGKQRHIGIYRTADEAQAAYFAVAQQRFGEFARIE